MSRWRSFLPDLMTVRAVMVRAALEKKKRLTHCLHQSRVGGLHCGELLHKLG